MNIIIVGCGNVGFETAKLLSEDHNLLLVDIHQPQYITDFIEGKENVLFVQADATDPDQMEKAIEAFTDRHHEIDALVSTIGAIIPGTPIDDFERFKRNFGLNFFGNLVPIKSVLSRMIPAKSGRLVIISSTAGHHSPCCLEAYAPAKWALESLSRTLRSELRPYGVTVDVICPASIKNRYSQTFTITHDTIESTDVASCIQRILQRPKNANHFIPAQYRMLHLVERMSPVLMDRFSGLKRGPGRKKMLRSQKVNTVLIAGASSGVGKKLAYLNAGIAGRLYLIDKSDEPLRALKGEIEAMSACQVSIAAIDMRDTRSIKTYADSIQGVDLFINIPGQPEKGAVSDTPLDVYKRDLDMNFFGVLYLLAELFKKESKPKKVIIVLPPVVIAGQRYHSSFTCAMSAFWAMTRSLRRVYGNELQVTEVISPLDSPVAYPLAADGADVSHVKGPLMADALAQNIYKAELKGREVVVTPVTARLLLVEEALTTGLFNKVHT